MIDRPEKPYPDFPLQVLADQIGVAFYRFPGKEPPTRLHVSPEIYEQLRESVDARGGSIGGKIFFLGRPVTKVLDLNRFRWVREMPNAWVCGPTQREEKDGL